MTTDGMQLPAHLQQYAGASDASSLVTTVNMLPSLSIKGKQFTIRKGDDQQKFPTGQPMDVVILAVDPVGNAVARSYYSKPYASGSDEQPDCASSDGITPDGHVDKPQARSCAECQHNVFGTARNQDGSMGKGKRCSDFKNLIVVQPEDVGNNDLLMLRVPATSLKSLSSFGRKLQEHNLPPHMIVTQVSFQDTEYPALNFNPARYLSADEAPIADARAHSETVKLALPSKNKQAAKPVAPEPLAISAPPSTPEVPKKTLVLTNPDSGFGFENFYEKGWTDEQLIEHGHAEYI